MINFMVWNVRGAAKKSSNRRLKLLCKIHKMPFFALLEPKVDQSKINSYMRKWGFEGCCNNVNGKIWLFWRFNVSVQCLIDNPQHLTIKISHPQEQHSIVITIVYAKCSKEERLEL